jgi:hypothetical protein
MVIWEISMKKLPRNRNFTGGGGQQTAAKFHPLDAIKPF